MSPTAAPNSRTLPIRGSRGGLEIRGPGAVTVLLLLLLMGSADPRSGAALTWAAHVLVAEDAGVATERQRLPARRRPAVAAQVSAAVRLSVASVSRVLSVLDATLPAPRAPDAGRVA